MKTTPIILLRGGGDLATGVAMRLHRCGLKVIITELPQPLAVRRLVSFCEAVYRGQITVEGLTARLAADPDEAIHILQTGEIPVLIDPQCETLHPPHSTLHPPSFTPHALVDARMTKRPPGLGMDAAPLVIGLGPGFVAGENCHAAIETNRGHYLGRVIWDGAPQPNTGIPGAVTQKQSQRVLRAPADGILHNLIEIGAAVKSGQLIAEVDGQPILAPFDGILRGLLHDGLTVKRGLKLGDVDPRNDPQYALTVSEKALAIGGGVLEALLTRPASRSQLWT
ncbi:MAG: EF2563 family selenium-dependent molybdenum hydroxylase system protein [Chloroflexi bacterium]|nr:EF2563 family selenium-dependent molybdenum hydroxylase system protein [Chloroflexota bacterium]